MPARIIDGDAIARSDRLARCTLAGRSWYALLLTVALANGSFECDARSICFALFPKLAPEMTPEQIAGILADYETHKLLFTWTGHDGKRWGYFTGIETRLPKPSDIKGRRLRQGEPVPARNLARFLGRPYREVLAELAERIGEPYVAELAGLPAPRARKGSRISRAARDVIASNHSIGFVTEKKSVGVGASAESTAEARAEARAGATSPPPASSSLRSSSLRSSSLRSSSGGGGEEETEKKETAQESPKKNGGEPSLEARSAFSGQAQGPLAPPAPPLPPWVAERKQAKAGWKSIAEHAREFEEQARERAQSASPLAANPERALGEFTSAAFGVSVGAIWAATRRVSASAPYLSAQLDEARRAGRVEIGDGSPGPGRVLHFWLEGGDGWCVIVASGGWRESRREFFDRVRKVLDGGAGACTGPGDGSGGQVGAGGEREPGDG
jgi:hypothetical protein